MCKNVHPLERAARIIAGVVLISLAFWGPKNYWFLIGIVPLTTGLLGWCPAYSLFGMSTCKRNPSDMPK